MGERKIKISYGEAFTFFYVNVQAPGEDSVELIEAPDKVEYTKGEKLELKGLKVRVIQADGTQFESLNGDKLTIFDGPLDNVGERKIKISYGDAFTFFYVTVKEGTTEPAEPTEPTTPTEPTDPSEEGTTTPTEPTDPSEEGTTTPTEAPTEPSKGDEEVKPTNETDKKDAQRKTGMPWWGILLIALGSAGVGAGIVIVIVKKKS